MAIGTENYPNTAAISVSYPYGGIKNNSGGGDGTPINKLTNDDIHQTLRKILALAGITPNNLPDNVLNGFQYIEGLSKLFSRNVVSGQFPPLLTVTASFNGGILNTTPYGAGNYRIRVEMNFTTTAAAHAINIKLRDNTNLIDLTNSERYITTPANSGVSVVLLWEGAILAAADVAVVMSGGTGSAVIKNAQYFIEKL